MTDQAKTLRVIRGGATSQKIKIPTRRAFAISGGKGGVGKSTIALNLAIAYAQAGNRTLVLDIDLGMADLNLLLGVAPDKSMLDALGGTATIEDIIVKAHGIELLPALNGSYVLSTLGGAARGFGDADLQSATLLEGGLRAGPAGPASRRIRWRAGLRHPGVGHRARRVRLRRGARPVRAVGHRQRADRLA